MKLKEIYTFTNNKQIWRIIPAGENIIIEERQSSSKEVFFSSVEINTGKIIFRNYQPVEKFWIGIEAVHKDVIFFHKFSKPDMPGHKEIIAVDFYSLKNLWSTSEYSFLFAYEGKIYSFINMFEGRKYVVLDYRSGDVLETLDPNSIDINELRFRSHENEFFNDASFPELCKSENPLINILESDTGLSIEGRVECVSYDEVAFASYHIGDEHGTLRNLFAVVDIKSEKVIFKEVLNNRTAKFIPETFFLKGNKLFLLKDKSVLKVYLIL